MPDGRLSPRAPLRTYFSVSADARDQRLLSELRTWLRHQESCGWLQGGICRAEIVPRDRVAEVAATHLQQADVIFALLSVEYLQSDDCLTKELAPAILQQEAGLARLVLIHMRAVPLGELTVKANGKSVDLRQWEWFPAGSAQPIDSDRRRKREATWQKVEYEIRTLVMKICAGPLDVLTAEELALYRQKDEGGLGAFLDRYYQVIRAGLQAGAGWAFEATVERNIASEIYRALFCDLVARYEQFNPERDRSFAHFLFKVAHISGQSLVRSVRPRPYIEIT